MKYPITELPLLSDSIQPRTSPTPLPLPLLSHPIRAAPHNGVSLTPSRGRARGPCRVSSLSLPRELTPPGSPAGEFLGSPDGNLSERTRQALGLRALLGLVFKNICRVEGNAITRAFPGLQTLASFCVTFSGIERAASGERPSS